MGCSAKPLFMERKILWTTTNQQNINGPLTPILNLRSIILAHYFEHTRFSSGKFLSIKETNFKLTKNHVVTLGRPRINVPCCGIASVINSAEASNGA